MNIDAVEKEPTHAGALPGVVDGEFLKLGSRCVLIENIESLAAMFRIRDGVQPEMLDIFFFELVDLPQCGKHFAERGGDWDSVPMLVAATLAMNDSSLQTRLKKLT